VKEDLIEITLDYSGEKIKNHTMDLELFTQSLNGLNSLLRIVSKELGVKEDDITIDIGVIEEGCLKTKITFAVISSFMLYQVSDTAFSHYEEKFQLWDKVDNIVVKIYKETKQFIQTKKTILNSKEFPTKLAEASLVQTHLMQNIYAHESVDDLTFCLEEEAETLDISSTKNEESLKIYRSDRQALQITPFEQSEVKDLEESVDTEVMSLYLEGALLDSKKWVFYTKGFENKNRGKIHAEVWDNDLLKLGRENLEQFRDKELRCEVKIKTVKKIGSKRAKKEYIITKCNMDDEFGLE